MAESSEMVAVRNREQIATVAKLARDIWTDHYVPIIGRAQVDYMLERFQSEQAIRHQIAEGQWYYLLQEQGRPLGYLGLIPDPANASLMISKIYVYDTQRGKGYGRRMLEFVESLCRDKRFDRIWLTVNKHNRHSIAWYQRMGFENSGAVVQDIGGGFVMDDYRLDKVLDGA